MSYIYMNNTHELMNSSVYYIHYTLQLFLCWKQIIWYCNCSLFAMMCQTSKQN